MGWGSNNLLVVGSFNNGLWEGWLKSKGLDPNCTGTPRLPEHLVLGSVTFLALDFLCTQS